MEGRFFFRSEKKFELFIVLDEGKEKNKVNRKEWKAKQEEHFKSKVENIILLTTSCH